MTPAELFEDNDSPSVSGVAAKGQVTARNATNPVSKMDE